jgi:hypothetical protein
LRGKRDDSSQPSCDLLDLGADVAPGLDGVCKLPLEQAVVVDLAVDGARLQELHVGPARGTHADLVGTNEVYREIWEHGQIERAVGEEQEVA